MIPIERQSDEALCLAASEGNQRAEELLVIRYSRLVRSCARPYFLTGGDSEDLIQEGMVGLIHAIRAYQSGQNASFRTFAEICIRRRLYSVIRTESGKMQMPLNQSIPLDTPFFDNNSYTSNAEQQSQRSPEDDFIERESMQLLLNSVRKQLSEFEAKVLGYYLDGLSYREIAEQISKSPKSVDNAVQRIRRKIARQFLSGDLSNS